MKKTLSTLLVATLAFAIFSCNKSSDSAAATTNQATVDGTTVDFSTITSATKSSDGTSLTFSGGGATSAGTGNAISFNLRVTKGLKAGKTYSITDSTVYLAMALSLNSKTYASGYDNANSVTIAALDSSSVSGSYSAKVYSQDSIRSTKTVTGNFTSKLH